MKRKFIPAIAIASFVLLLTNCNSSTSKDDMQKQLQKDAQNALKASSEDKDAEKPASPSGDVITVSEAIKFIAAAETNKGQVLTINGYPRGTTKTVNGEFMLYVSDQTGTGLPEENFACYFKEEAREAVRKHKAGEKIMVTGTIGYNNGMVVLKSCSLSE